MATHDYSIANATGAAFRADVNNALLAIATMNSSSTPPPVAYPGMLWTDLSAATDGVVKRRNAANTAWLTDVGIDSVARAAAAAAQATADAALPRTGGTMTGGLFLPSSDPSGLMATSRVFTDRTYQPMLLTPIAGSLLVGAAAGWNAKLDPGPANSVLAVTGGLPTWQLTATTASSNALVRAGADGTIDASFIPAVASGLKYRGTFKPVVNDEYPAAGDNGSGAGGVPAVGDFWVIDGLTTGGYTYLSGSLAGVTVYNGDSVAYDGAKWYRMGSSVSLQGYLKTDGSSSMAGNLDLGSHDIINVANITARTGTPPLVSGFQFDATNIFLSPQRGTTGPDLPNMPTGQLGTDLGRMQLFVGASGSNTALIPVTFFSSTANYLTSSYVYNAATGLVYRAGQAITAGAFNSSQWRQVLDTESGVSKLGDSMSGNLGIYKDQAAFTGLTISNYSAASGQAAGIQISQAGGAPYGGVTVFNSTHATFPDSMWVGTYVAKALALGVGSAAKFTISASGNITIDATTIIRNTGGVLQIRDTRTIAADNGGRISLFAKDNNGTDVDMCGISSAIINGTPNGVYGRMDFVTTDAGVRRRVLTLEPGGQMTQACQSYGHLMTMAGVGAVAGNSVLALQVTTQTANTDQMALFCTRSVAGTGWDTANWFLRRAVDGAQHGYLMFGSTTNNQGIALGYGSNVNLYVGTNQTVYIRQELTLQYFQGAAGQGVIRWGDSTNNYQWWDGTRFVFNGGPIYASAFNPTCDSRLKTDIVPVEPRSLDAVQLYEYEREGFEGRVRGPIAQEVEAIAPDYVTTFLDMDGTPTKTVDVMTLALEIALNALARLRVLEAAATPPAPSTQ